MTDNGNEFLGTEFQKLLSLYGLQQIHTTIKNPQANFVEHVHQSLGNMICTFEFENFEFD
jgi:transposase InsO family protein